MVGYKQLKNYIKEKGGILGTKSQSIDMHFIAHRLYPDKFPKRVVGLRGTRQRTRGGRTEMTKKEIGSWECCAGMHATNLLDSLWFIHQESRRVRPVNDHRHHLK